MNRSLTVAEKLLLAAWRLFEEGLPIFSAEDLVVTAWKDFPEAFGLRGFLDDRGNPIYPDSNRVFMEIMGSSPLRKRGFIEKVGNKKYRLTAAGENHALGIQNGERGKSPKRAALDRSTATAFRRYSESRAMAKWGKNFLEEITFHDACSFWGISSRSSANDLRARLAHFSATMSEIDDIIGGEDFTIMHGDYPVSSSIISQMNALNDFLKEKFQSEIDVISQRTER